MTVLDFRSIQTSGNPKLLVHETVSASVTSGQGRGWMVGRCTCIHAGRRQLHGKSRSSFDTGRSLILSRP
jgi:hypothetical protein